jgi:hypothetical protein
MSRSNSKILFVRRRLRLLVEGDDRRGPLSQCGGGKRLLHVRTIMKKQLKKMPISAIHTSRKEYNADAPFLYHRRF